MLIVYCFGVPAVYFALLWRRRRELYPANVGRDMVLVYHADSEAADVVVHALAVNLSQQQELRRVMQLCQQKLALRGLDDDRARRVRKLAPPSVERLSGMPPGFTAPQRWHDDSTQHWIDNGDDDGSSGPETAQSPTAPPPLACFHYHFTGVSADSRHVLDHAILEWSRTHYDVQYDIALRDANPNTVHLKFLVQVWTVPVPAGCA